MHTLILAHPDDETALRVCLALRARHGAAEVGLVSGKELELAPRWVHQLAGPGGPAADAGCEVTSEVRLASGALLDGARLGVVFNRLRYVAMSHFALARPGDQDYAVAETYALWLSWLASLPCPVVNPATALGLAVQQRSQAEWLWLAGQAGLPAQEYCFTTDPRRFRPAGLAPHRRLPTPDVVGNYPLAPVLPALVGRQPTFYLEPLDPAAPLVTVVVAGDAAVGAPAAGYEEALQRLRGLAGCDLLQVDFACSASGAWRVAAVSSYPVTADPAQVQAIADWLDARGSR